MTKGGGQQQSEGLTFAGALFSVIKGKMRLDKFLKVSRLIKRRTVANEACDAGRVTVNDKVAKASQEVKEGDIIGIGFGNREVRAQILSIKETTKKDEAQDMVRYL